MAFEKFVKERFGGKKAPKETPPRGGGEGDEEEEELLSDNLYHVFPAIAPFYEVE